MQEVRGRYHGGIGCFFSSAWEAKQYGSSASDSLRYPLFICRLVCEGQRNGKIESLRATFLAERDRVAGDLPNAIQ
jgi:hypothetical protein